MKKLKNLNFTNINKKITIMLVIMTLFTFITPNYTQAAIDWESTLTKPVKQLFAMIVDAILMIAQQVVAPDTDVAMAVSLEETTTQTLWDDPQKVRYLSRLLLTPDAIFANKILILDPDFVNPIDNTETKAGGSLSGKIYPALVKLRQTIQNWYKGIRNLALVGLMSVLIYVGIRILITSVAEDKAKYKKLLVYWVTGICLVFVLQYIMSFTFYMAEQLTAIFGGSSTTSPAGIDLPSGSSLKMIDENNARQNYVTALTSAGFTPTGDYINESSGVLGKIPTLQQYSRLMTNSYGVGGFAYLIIYIALVGYTGFFLIVYLFRALKLAFLTMIAPLICLTYPIDKISDGQAQAFNKWLKEFLYNVLIQPFHLLIYMTLVGASLELVKEVPLFAIIALGAILPVEKLMKEMFGFNKAPGVGAFSGAAAGSMVGNAMQRIGSKAGNKNKDSKEKNNSSSERDSNGVREARNTEELGAYDMDAPEQGNDNQGQQQNENENENENNNQGQQQNENENENENNNQGQQQNENTNNEEEKDELDKQIEEHEQQAVDAREKAQESEENGENAKALGLNDAADWHQSQAEKLRQQKLLRDQEKEAERLRQQEAIDENEPPQENSNQEQLNEGETDDVRQQEPPEELNEGETDDVRQQEPPEETNEGETNEARQQETPEQLDQGQEKKPTLKQRYKASKTGARIEKLSNSRLGKFAGRKIDEAGKGLGAIGTTAKKSVQNKIGWQPEQYRGRGKEGAKALAKNVGRVAFKGARGAVKFGVKTGVRTAMGAGLGILAGSAALISGNPKAIGGAALAGAIAGGRVGSSLTSSTGKGYSKLKDTYDRGALGEKYDARKKKNEVQQFKNSPATDLRYRGQFDSERNIKLPDGRMVSQKDQAIDLASQIMEKSGITDDDALMRAVKMTQGFGEEKPGEQLLTPAQAMDIPTIAHNVKDSVYENRTNYEQELSNYQQRFMDKGIDNNTARLQAEKILKDTAKFKGKKIPAKVQQNPELASGTENAARPAGRTRNDSNSSNQRGQTGGTRTDSNSSNQRGQTGGTSTDSNSSNSTRTAGRTSTDNNSSNLRGQTGGTRTGSTPPNNNSNT